MIKNKKLQEIDFALNSLVIFRRLLTNDVLVPLRQLLDTEMTDPLVLLRQYAEFVSRLYQRHTNLTEYVLQLALEDENFYIVNAAKGIPADEMLDACVENELKILQRLASLKPVELQKEVSYYGILPEWGTSEIDFPTAYRERLRDIGKFGYGKYAQSSMFQLQDGKIVPVRYPDIKRFSELHGYERERQAVIDNTLALLAGKPAQNVLLYGDAGTGKSSTVKAIVNEYAGEGLRLIQVTKEQLREIPQVMESVMQNPLKFILYIDDLSFAAGDDVFNALKAALEGSVAARPKNLVIYATSNRRHFVREQFSDRDGDDIHRNDTVQEILSLSARFGLCVNFGKPGKSEYLQIAAALAAESGIDIEPEALAIQAEAFALAGSGRSPRTARQFIDRLCCENSGKGDEPNADT